MGSKRIKIRFLLSDIFWVGVIFFICGTLLGFYVAGGCR